MCRNITELRGLEPPATETEIDAAALQYIRKVSGLRQPPKGAEAEYQRAVDAVADATRTLLGLLPARKQPRRRCRRCGGRRSVHGWGSTRR